MSTGVSGANRSAAFRSAEPLAGARARAGQCRDDVSSSEKREAGPAAPLRIQRHPASDDQEGQNRIAELAGIKAPQEDAIIWAD